MANRRPVVAAGLTVMAMAMIVVFVGDPFRPAGAVEGAQEGPASAPEFGAVGASPFTSDGEIAVLDEGTSAAPSPATSSPDPDPTPGPTPLVQPRVPPRAAATMSTNPTPRPTARPGPTSAPTQGPPAPTAGVPPNPSPTPTAIPFSPPPPTPSPTPTPLPTPPALPAPTPAPTPDCSVVPSLVGLTVGNARAEWADAGFTGTFTPIAGLNNKVVVTQSQVAGACLPATASMTVTW